MTHRNDASDAPRKGVAFVDDYLPALLAQASHLISAEFHAIVTAKGFTVSEWRILASLVGAEPTSIGRLASTTTMKQPTVTRILDRMEAKGDVQRVPDKRDRRVTLVRITAQGTRSAQRLIPLAVEHARRVLEPFGQERAAALTSMLQRMIEAHRDATPGGSADDDRP